MFLCGWKSLIFFLNFSSLHIVKYYNFLESYFFHKNLFISYGLLQWCHILVLILYVLGFVHVFGKIEKIGVWRRVEAYFSQLAARVTYLASNAVLDINVRKKHFPFRLKWTSAATICKDS